MIALIPESKDNDKNGGNTVMRILVVEDEKEIADGISHILCKTGYQVDCVYDGESGLEYILSGIYDLILLDLMLPKLNGIDVVKKVRTENMAVPIIMLTAKSQVDDKIQGLNSGADDYVIKPFDKGELLARIGARLRKQAKENDGRISAFDIAINPSNYMLEKESKSIKLSKIEYQLIEYFMMNKNHILSKEMIINKIWGYNDETDYNNIEVYVSFLRKKLRFVQAEAVIATKKGIGYYLTCGD